MAKIDDKQIITDIVSKYVDAVKRDLRVSRAFIFGAYSRKAT